MTIREAGLRRIMYVVASLSVALSVATYTVIDAILPTTQPLYRIVTYASSIVPALIGVTFSGIVSNAVWSIWRGLDKSVYPNLSGQWVGAIVVSPSGEEIALAATIRHSPFVLQIDFDTSTASSVTLAAVARTDEGQHVVCYVYRATPRNPAHAAYQGAAHLRVRTDGPELELLGNYYTDRQTTGQIRLKPKPTSAAKRSGGIAGASDAPYLRRRWY